MPKIASPEPDVAAPPLTPALGRFHCEIVEQPGAAWDNLAAGFEDFCMEQSFAFAGSRWSRLRSVGMMLLEDGDPVAMALALIATLPVLGLGLAYVKFGPLWRKSGTPADPQVLFAILEALKKEFGVKRRLLVRIMPPADPGFEPEWKETLKRANFSFHAALSDRERYLVDLTLSE